MMPLWLDPTPLTRAFVGSFANAPVRDVSQAHEFNLARREFLNARLTGVWVDNPPIKHGGRTKGAKDKKPRKKLGAYRRNFKK